MSSRAFVPSELPFDREVAKVVRAIPPGTTLSYGAVALRAGKPRGARAVAWALRRLGNVPWWRVIRSDGTLAPEVARAQAPLLRDEGLRVEGRRVKPPAKAEGPRAGGGARRTAGAKAGGGPGTRGAGGKPGRDDRGGERRRRKR